MTTFAPGTALTVNFVTEDSSGALYNPSPLPVIVYARQPDGTAITPAALTHTGTGTFEATVFTTLQTATLTGTYQMGAYTSDALDAGNGWYKFEWSVGVNYVSVNNDKTGYALTGAEHTAISGTDVPVGLTTQGYTTVRAGYLDTLNGLVAAIFAYATSAVTTAGSWAKYISDTLASILSRTSASGGPFVSPVADDGITTTIYVSRDYNSADGWSLIYPTTQTVLNTDTFSWSVGPFGSPYLTQAGTYYDANHIQVELTAAQTGGFGKYIGQSLDLEIRTTRATRKIEQVRGKAQIKGVVNP